MSSNVVPVSHMFRNPMIFNFNKTIYKCGCFKLFILCSLNQKNIMISSRNIDNSKIIMIFRRYKI